MDQIDMANISWSLVYERQLSGNQLELEEEEECNSVGSSHQSVNISGKKTVSNI